MMLDSPLFILGSPRSGTTLLRLLLTSHPNLLIPPECGFILWNANKFQNWNINDSNNPSRVKDLVDSILKSKKMDTWGISQEKLIRNISGKCLNYGDVCIAVLQTYAVKVGKKFTIWGDKNNYYIHHVGKILELFPKARFIHIVRDGRDVACSYREVMQLDTESPYKPQLPVAIDDIAEEWSSNVNAIHASSSRVPTSNFTTVHYEDIVCDCENQMIHLCNWLGLHYNIEMLDFYKKNETQSLEPKQTMGWKNRTKTPVNDSTVGRYRQILSEQEITTFNKIAKEALHRFHLT